MRPTSYTPAPPFLRITQTSEYPQNDHSLLTPFAADRTASTDETGACRHARKIRSHTHVGSPRVTSVQSTILKSNKSRQSTMQPLTSAGPHKAIATRATYTFLTSLAPTAGHFASHLSRGSDSMSSNRRRTELTCNSLYYTDRWVTHCRL